VIEGNLHAQRVYSAATGRRWRACDCSPGRGNFIRRNPGRADCRWQQTCYAGFVRSASDLRLSLTPSVRQQ
jgi:hypothetical protein